mmetsp:Transcript_25470/g.38461  ORF Transcript_25470/g.38461 Transcript_25470/m.38461 type:complete len:93 (+) Transcript_25470:130-408(+)
MIIQKSVYTKPIDSFLEKGFQHSVSWLAIEQVPSQINQVSMCNGEEGQDKYEMRDHKHCSLSMQCDEAVQAHCSTQRKGLSEGGMIRLIISF